VEKSHAGNPKDIHQWHRSLIWYRRFENKNPRQRHRQASDRITSVAPGESRIPRVGQEPIPSLRFNLFMFFFLNSDARCNARLKAMGFDLLISWTINN